jgi:hypothetical protein
VWCGAVPQIDDQRIGHSAKSWMAREPAIGTAKTICSRRSAGDSSD